MNKIYDYLIVGAGIYGATFACMAHRHGKRCLVIDKRNHLGGNIYCENIEGINVHKYGAHIFHTSNKKVWDFANSIVEFNRYTNSPIANYKGKQYNLPFNMNTFYQMWGVLTPAEAQAKIEEQRQEALKRMKADGVTEPRNLEEQAQLLIGKDIYEILIKDIQKNNGGVNAANYRLLSSSAYQFALFTTIIISMTVSKVFQLVDIINLSMVFSKV